MAYTLIKLEKSFNLYKNKIINSMKQKSRNKDRRNVLEVEVLNEGRTKNTDLQITGKDESAAGLQQALGVRGYIDDSWKTSR